MNRRQSEIKFAKKALFRIEKQLVSIVKVFDAIRKLEISLKKIGPDAEFAEHMLKTIKSAKDKTEQAHLALSFAAMYARRGADAKCKK